MNRQRAEFCRWEVWMCDAGVYVSQSDAIRSAERSNRKHHVPAEQAEKYVLAAKTGRYVRANWFAVDDTWTRTAKEIHAFGEQAERERS